MKLYTKKGDQGQTALLGGKKVAKSHLRIEAYGTVDELNAHLGLLSDLCKFDEDVTYLTRIQHCLFAIGAQLATPEEETSFELPELDKCILEELEAQIDEITALAPPLKNFILPGGHTTISQCHIARCVCRRAERCVIALHEVAVQDSFILMLLNRLSDYLFALGRKWAHKMNIQERIWQK